MAENREPPLTDQEIRALRVMIAAGNWLDLEVDAVNTPPGSYYPFLRKKSDVTFFAQAAARALEPTS